MKPLISLSFMIATLIFSTTCMAFNPQPEPPAQTDSSRQTTSPELMEPPAQTDSSRQMISPKLMDPTDDGGHPQPPPPPPSEYDKAY